MDGAGNITSRVINGTTSTYGYNADNEMTSAPAGTYSYDADGNQISNSAGLKLAYNAKNQTTSITPAGQSATALTYLGAGQATLTAIGAATQEPDVLGVGYRTDSTGTTYYTQDNNSDLLSERLPGGGYDYYVPDSQGSVLAVTDTNGNAADTYSYDPYGQTTASTGTTANVWGFQQGEQLPGGDYHFGQRYYDPSTGRWTQEDPLNQITDPAQADRYLFAGESPLINGDPTGRLDAASVLRGCAESGLQSAVVSAGSPLDTGLGCAAGAGADLFRQAGCDTCAQVVDAVGNFADGRTVAEGVEEGYNEVSDLADEVF